jgi:hypothetical protein
MNLITVGLIAAISAVLACGSSADASPLASVGGSSILVGTIDTFGSTASGSLAWAGENETLVDVALTPVATSADDVNIEMITPIAAPEPPAIVLAGMALGGVLCGRSLLRKKNRTTTTTTTEDRS